VPHTPNQARFGVFGNLVARGKRVNRPFAGLTREVIEHDLLAALKRLLALVEEVIFAAFFAGDFECHNRVRWLVFCVLEKTGLFQRGVGPVFGAGFQSPGGELDDDVRVELRHPEALGFEVGREGARHVFGHVTAHAAFLLGHASAMDDAAAGHARSGDGANLGHKVFLLKSR